MVYHYRKIETIYACLYGEIQFVVPINKGKKALLCIQLSDYSAELGYSEENIFYQNY